MPKLTIIVTEKTEQLLDGRNLIGYETKVEFEAEGQEDSPLRDLVEPIYKAIGFLMSAYHGAEPFVARDLDPDKSFSLESEMAKEKAKIDQPLPSEP